MDRIPHVKNVDKMATSLDIERPSSLEQIENGVSRLTGRTVAELRTTPIDELRTMVEKEKKSHLHIYSVFPFIGRGNVLRDKIVSHDDVEKALTQAIR